MVISMLIANALFSKSLILVLQWVYLHPERRFHLNELRRLTGLGSASIQREIDRLEAAELIVVKRIANLRCIKANPESPVFGELRSLVEKTMGKG